MEAILAPKAMPGDEWYWLRETAVFCDAYTLQVWKESQIVRFAFGEYTDGETKPFYRVGIAMPLSDAKTLLRSLTRAIKNAEAEEEEEEKEASTEKPPRESR
jgi:hypothetical protein